MCDFVLCLFVFYLMDVLGSFYIYIDNETNEYKQ